MLIKEITSKDFEIEKNRLKIGIGILMDYLKSGTINSLLIDVVDNKINNARLPYTLLNVNLHLDKS